MMRILDRPHGGIVLERYLSGKWRVIAIGGMEKRGRWKVKALHGIRPWTNIHSPDGKTNIIYAVSRDEAARLLVALHGRLCDDGTTEAVA